MARRVLATAPTITIASTTNYNQSIATFNATVNPNGASTDIKFQYSTNGSTWTDGLTVTGVTGSSQSIYSNHTGFTENTLYYVRAVATNSAGTSTSSNTTFTTWHLIDFGSASSTTVSVPTVTPTNGSTVIPTLYDICVVGGGAGSYFGGGGGGQVSVVSSRAFNDASNLTISVNVGSGGAATANGGSSSLTNSSFTSVSATGGYTSDGTNGGTNGDGTHAGGIGYNTSSGGKNPIIADGWGGGGGATANGSNGAVNDVNSGVGYGYGGNGGAGYSHSRWSVSPFNNGLLGSGGGGGYLATNGGSNGSSGGGTYGCGGSCSGSTNAAGNVGAIWFRYYGP